MTCMCSICGIFHRETDDLITSRWIWGPVGFSQLLWFSPLKIDTIHFGQWPDVGETLNDYTTTLSDKIWDDPRVCLNMVYPLVMSTVCYWTLPSRNRWFTNEKWWCSIVMLVYQRVKSSLIPINHHESLPIQLCVVHHHFPIQTRGHPGSWCRRISDIWQNESGHSQRQHVAREGHEFSWFTIWLFNSSPWKPWPIEIDGLPSYKMVIFHGYVSHNQMVILNHYFNMLNWKMKKNDAKCKEYLYSIKNDSSFRWRLLRGVRLYRILVLVLRPELIQQKWIKAERSKGVQIIQTNIP